MQTVTDFYSRKFFCCPCLLHAIDQIFDSGHQILNEILLYLQELENFPSEKIYCICINKKEDLMVICEQHLKVALIATFDYSCLSNQETDFVVELKKQQSFFVRDV